MNAAAKDRSRSVTGGRDAERGIHHRGVGGGAPQLLSVPEAARALAIGERACWRLVAAGELASVRIGRRRLISLADLESFIADRREGGRR